MPMSPDLGGSNRFRAMASACSGSARPSPGAFRPWRSSPPAGSRSSPPPCFPARAAIRCSASTSSPMRTAAILMLLPGQDGDEVAGRLQLFDERLVDAMNVAVHLLQAPESLAWLLEAAGAVALERCGAILDERTAVAGAS